MKVFTHDIITRLGITPAQCVEWVGECFRMKPECNLPAKISMKMDGNIFYNTMPCYIPEPVDRFGAKVVTRFPEAVPALNSELLLYSGKNGNGELLALFDANWITAMRTGAVAATAINLLKKSDAKVYSFIGLGNTARATMLCLLSTLKEEMTVRLMAYKDQADDFIRRFKDYTNVRFEIVDTAEKLISGSDVIVSCVTAADSQIAPDSCFGEGCLVVPIHTRGFQNCDLFFDKVFADDYGHVHGFKYFDKFRSFAEMSDVILGKKAGRSSDRERILAYNIGIALHDVYFASKIYDMAIGSVEDIAMDKVKDKFWI